MTEHSENDYGSSADAPATSLGIYDRSNQDGMTTQIDLVAIAASLLWLLGASVYFFVWPVDGDNQTPDTANVETLLAFLVVLLPAAMIWVVAATARNMRAMREESRRLQSAMDAIRQSHIAFSQSAATGTEPNSVARKLDEIAAATKKTEIVLATFSTRREQQQAASIGVPIKIVSDDQPALALGTQAEDFSPPLESEDFIRALNFPETAEDELGFASLRRALKNRNSSRLIQAAQDILTLLSQDGIYMDDLRPDRARPEIWRHFGQGLRGRPIAALGGVRDRSSLALTSGRMKQDPIFRDAAHHFLRLFDKSFADFEKTASDSEIAALAETRTARAFMLLGRVAGTFD